MRLVLILALIHGIVPGLGEIAETVVHYAVEGHLAHSAADHGDLGDVGHEHGCGGAQHLCSCCASQVFVTQPALSASGVTAAPVTGTVIRRQLVSLHDPAPPRRPPIVS